MYAEITARPNLCRGGDDYVVLDATGVGRATLESTGDGILVTNDRRAVTGWNENYRRMWRLPGVLLEHRDHADARPAA